MNIYVNPGNAQPARRTCFQRVKAREPLRTACGSRGCFWYSKSTPRRLLMQWTCTRRFQKGKSTATVRTAHGLQGMVWCPKPTPSAAGEALQCRAGGAPVRRSEEIRKRSNALDFPDVRISQARTQSATHRSNRSNALLGKAARLSAPGTLPYFQRERVSSPPGTPVGGA